MHNDTHLRERERERDPSTCTEKHHSLKMQADVSDSDTHIERETHRLTNTHTHTLTDTQSHTQTETHAHRRRDTHTSVNILSSPSTHASHLAAMTLLL